MMDRTDRHYRRMMRCITKHTLLYTEMVTTGAILHGPRDRELAYDPIEHPIALQLGGDDPEALASVPASPKTVATTRSTSMWGVRRVGSRPAALACR